MDHDPNKPIAELSPRELTEFKLEYLERHKSTFMQNIEVLDRQLLALSAGTLGLSLTFVSSLVDLDTAVLLLLLAVAWIALTTSIVSVITGLRFATRADHMKVISDGFDQMAGIGEFQKSGPDFRGGQTNYETENARLELHNKVSAWSFVVGIAAMLLFILINVFAQQNAVEAAVGESTPTATVAETT